MRNLPRVLLAVHRLLHDDRNVPDVRLLLHVLRALRPGRGPRRRERDADFPSGAGVTFPQAVPLKKGFQGFMGSVGEQ
jgi:hypothetical protein